jgi:hypothetical protein
MDNIITNGVIARSQLNIINRIGFVNNNFPNHSGMDFKKINPSPGHRSPFETSGNFAYGAYTYAIGIDRQVALLGAGYTQLRSGNARLRDFSSYFDDPNDAAEIIRGREYAACMLR